MCKACKGCEDMQVVQGCARVVQGLQGCKDVQGLQRG